MHIDQSVRSKRDPNRRLIHVYCAVHGGPKGFTHLVVTNVKGLLSLIRTSRVTA
jgi:hypothetical protein